MAKHARTFLLENSRTYRMKPHLLKSEKWFLRYSTLNKLLRGHFDDVIFIISELGFRLTFDYLYVYIRSPKLYAGAWKRNISIVLFVTVVTQT